MECSRSCSVLFIVGRDDPQHLELYKRLFPAVIQLSAVCIFVDDF